MQKSIWVGVICIALGYAGSTLADPLCENPRFKPWEKRIIYCKAPNAPIPKPQPQPKEEAALPSRS